MHLIVELAIFFSLNLSKLKNQQIKWFNPNFKFQKFDLIYINEKDPSSEYILISIFIAPFETLRKTHLTNYISSRDFNKLKI